MTPAARSVCYFGYYLYVVGLSLITVPNLFLRSMQLPETNEVWIRIVGVLVFCLGYYYHKSSVYNNVSFLKLTIPARIFAALCFFSFVLLKFAPPTLAGFGAVDLLAAVWTFIAFRKWCSMSLFITCAYGDNEKSIFSKVKTLNSGAC